MANYILRKIDDELWARVKARAQKDQLPLRAVVLALLAHYVEHGLSIKIHPAESKKRP